MAGEDWRGRDLVRRRWGREESKSMQVPTSSTFAGVCGCVYVCECVYWGRCELPEVVGESLTLVLQGPSWVLLSGVSTMEA